MRISVSSKAKQMLRMGSGVWVVPSTKAKARFQTKNALSRYLGASLGRFGGPSAVYLRGCRRFYVVPYHDIMVT
jgi:hypothetical protein